MFKTVGSTNLRTLWMSYMNVLKGKGEGRIGLAACLRKMSASSCFLNELGLGEGSREGSFLQAPLRDRRAKRLMLGFSQTTHIMMSMGQSPWYDIKILLL